MDYIVEIISSEQEFEDLILHPINKNFSSCAQFKVVVCIMTDIAPSSKFGHSFGFRTAKFCLAGTGLGLLSAVLMELLDTKGKINKWIWSLRKEGLIVENLEEEVEVCKMFYLLYSNYVKPAADAEGAGDANLLRRNFDRALDLTCDLSFMGEQVKNGLLNTYVEGIQAGKIDPLFDIRQDQEALTLVLDILEALDEIQRQVAQSEAHEIDDRNKRFSDYTDAKSKHEEQQRNYEMQKWELDLKERRAKNPTELQAVRKLIAENEESKPDPNDMPKEPPGINNKLKSDMIMTYKTVIQNRLQKIYKFIKHRVETFKKANPRKSNLKEDVKNHRKKVEEEESESESDEDESEDEEIEEQDSSSSSDDD